MSTPVSGRRATLDEALRERRAPDDAAASVFVHGDRAVVLRLRFEHGRRVLIVDDGGEAVRVDHLATLADLSHILPMKAEEGDVGYEFARAVIARAFSSKS